MRCQQRFHFAPQGVVPGAGAIEKRPPRRGITDVSASPKIVSSDILISELLQKSTHSLMRKLAVVNTWIVPPV
jgi:hypothetical protein